MGVRFLHYSDVENAFDDPERIGRLAGTIDARRDDRTLVVATGDVTAPGVLSLASDGRHALELSERIEPDLATLGNHDFDNGLDAIREVVERSPATWVSTNVFLGSGRFGADAGVVPTAVREVAGERYGFVGLLAPETETANPHAGDLAVSDPVQAARDALAALDAEGVDHTVALAHLRDDEALAHALDLDLVLGGHVHAERVDRVDGTLLVRPGANATSVLELEHDGAGWTVTRHDVSAGPLHDGVAAALRERKAAAGLDETVATLGEPLERDRALVFDGHAPIGEIVADAYRWATGADVGLQNSGGIREGPPLAGEVTAADLVGVVPFDEPVVVAELTGRELDAVLRESDGARLDFGEPAWWHGYASGATFGPNDDAPTVDGAPIDPRGTYTLATSAFLFHTPHEFPTLEARHRVDSTDRPQYEVLVEYARSVGIDPHRRAVPAGDPE